MKLRYHGHACFSLRCESGPILVFDPFDESVTYPDCALACDAALVSHDHFDHNCVRRLRGNFEVIRTAGEHRVGNVRIAALPCFHDRQRGALRGGNLAFRLECEGLALVHLGDLGHMPDAALCEALRDADVLLIPIGGVYTIDTPEAEALIRLLRPKHAVAMHYRTDAYDCGIADSEAFARDLGAARMPREIEISPDTVRDLPAVMIMDYQ